MTVLSSFHDTICSGDYRSVGCGSVASHEQNNQQGKTSGSGGFCGHRGNYANNLVEDDKSRPARREGGAGWGGGRAEVKHATALYADAAYLTRMNILEEEGGSRMAGDGD